MEEAQGRTTHSTTPTTMSTGCDRPCRRPRPSTWLPSKSFSSLSLPPPSCRPPVLLATSMGGGGGGSDDGTVNGIPLTRKLTYAGPPQAAVGTIWFMAKNFIAGTAAGIAEAAVGHPLDTIKVRMQAASTTVAVAGVAQMNAVQLLRSTIKHEGFMALYRGVSSRIVGAAVANSVLFGANGAFKKLFDADTNLPLSGAFVLASACTGAAEAAIWTPMDLLKTRCQVEYGKTVKVTPWTVAKQLVKDHGVFRGLYAGGGPTFLREVVGNMIYFTVYQTAKQNIMRARGLKEGDTLTFILAGGCAGTSYWLSILPLDTVKSIVQAQETRISARQVAADLYAKGGIAAFYRGVGPAMLRAFPACAATWTTFEYSLLALQRFE